MNRDLFSGTICQCGGVARGPKVHFGYFAGWQAEKGWKCRLLLTCECFAPGIGKTGYPEPNTDTDTDADTFTDTSGGGDSRNYL